MCAVPPLVCSFHDHFKYLRYEQLGHANIYGCRYNGISYNRTAFCAPTREYFLACLCKKTHWKCDIVTYNNVTNDIHYWSKCRQLWDESQHTKIQKQQNYRFLLFVYFLFAHICSEISGKQKRNTLQHSIADTNSFQQITF